MSRRIARKALAALLILAALSIIETGFGYAAYHSRTWNSDHTEILTGWAATWYVLTILNTALIGLSLAGALTYAAYRVLRGGQDA